MQKRELATFSSGGNIYNIYDRSTQDRYIVVASRPAKSDKFINHPITEDVAFYLIGKDHPIENLEIHSSAPSELERILRESMEQVKKCLNDETNYR